MKKVRKGEKLAAIKRITLRKIIDSRGNPTVEADVFCDGGFGRAAAPSGASTGTYEVAVAPKNGLDYAIVNARKKVIPQLVGEDALGQKTLDALLREIDGTDNFSEIGGAVSIALSLAIAKAAAASLNVPLYDHVRILMGDASTKFTTPKPLGNVLGGGRHAVNGTDIQEFLAISFGQTALESVFANAQVHKYVVRELKKRLPTISIGKGDEGAWVAPVSNEEALDVVAGACKEVADEVGFDVRAGLDFAASEFYKDGAYHYKDKTLSPAEQIDFVGDLVKQYNLFSVEDPLDESDFEGHAALTKKIGASCLVVGDDLFVTNKKRLEKGVKLKAGNAILVKPNQIGSLTDTIETVLLAKKNGYKTIISHRSGETTDESIAHLGTAFGSVAIKTGAVGGERIAKLNELIRIEEELAKRQ